MAALKPSCHPDERWIRRIYRSATIKCIPAAPRRILLTLHGPWRYKEASPVTRNCISSLDIAVGYIADILLPLPLYSICSAQGSTDALRFAIGGSGVWWALFSILSLLLLPDARFEEAQNPGVTEERDGLLTSEPTSEAAPVVATEWSVRREVVDEWKRLGNVLR